MIFFSLKEHKCKIKKYFCKLNLNCMQVLFKDIQKHLIDALSDAKNSIRIAVAWFTNYELFMKVCEKAKEGVNVELIIINDFINNNYRSLDWQYFISNKGVLRFANKEKPMHNKYCIIDDTVLINGSYNWTYFAENKNMENVMIIKNEENVIKAYCNEFDLIKKKLIIVKKNNRINLNELDENSVSVERLTSYELFKKGSLLEDFETVEYALKICPSIPEVRNSEIAKKVFLSKKDRCLKSSIGLGCHNDKNVIILPKGSKIPITLSHNFHTVHDNQTSINSPIVIGESLKASECKKIETIELINIPAKLAGQAKNTITMILDEFGSLQIIKKCLETGVSVRKKIDVDDYLMELK